MLRWVPRLLGAHKEKTGAAVASTTCHKARRAAQADQALGGDYPQRSQIL